MGPALLIIFVNLIVFIMVMRNVMRKRGNFGRNVSLESDNKKQAVRLIDPKEVERIMKGLKATISFFSLLGVTWVFGALAISSGAILFIYLFSICNGLQGLFIAVFHCFMDVK